MEMDFFSVKSQCVVLGFGPLTDFSLTWGKFHFLVMLYLLVSGSKQFLLMCSNVFMLTYWVGQPSEKVQKCADVVPLY